MPSYYKTYSNFRIGEKKKLVQEIFKGTKKINRQIKKFIKNITNLKKNNIVEIFCGDDRNKNSAPRTR